MTDTEGHLLANNMDVRSANLPILHQGKSISMSQDLYYLLLTVHWPMLQMLFDCR